jgi:hypothetical protein
MNKITIKRKNAVVEEMSSVSFARWACLVEALNFIQEKAEQLNLNVDNFLKPVAIDHYIEERYPAMLHDVDTEINLGILS